MNDTSQATTEATEDNLKQEPTRVLSRHDRTFLMHEAAKAHPLGAVKYLDGPYTDSDGEPTAAGRDLVMKSVAAGNLQDFIADQLGMKPREFGKKIKAASGVWADLWAVAQAAADSALIRLMVWRATVLKDPESLKFVLRIRGFSEKTAPTTTVNVDTGNKFVLAPPGLPYEEFVEFQKAMRAEGKTTHTASFTSERYKQLIGQVDDGDQRTPAAKKRHDEILSIAPPASCDDPVNEDEGGRVV